MFKLVASMVIYNNSFEEIERVIKEYYSENIEQKLIVIDNTNTGYLKEKIFALEPDVDYILSENVGYGTANNIAIKKYAENSKYFLIINPDIFVSLENIKKLIKYADTKDNFGIIMPKILSESNEIQYLCKLLPTPLNLFSRRFLFKLSYFNKLNYDYELRFLDYNSEFVVPVLSGCFMFCLSENLIREKGFDEEFFMYLEDVDLSRRMYKYNNYYYPEIEVYHIHKKESFKSLKMTIEHIKSGIKYFNKWKWFLDEERKEINNCILKK
ncbi:glycosyltransferase [Sebaldella sp. S0638]|uniref:glycosyltransferase n=1 Tax=Sebaldella sp. S0638 TaxID=2957809 RepID=UPI00209F2B0F|nr:glycosyltransferase family 2 protein [Sebaldella sp. S0638]MCP1225889.1 glycosyltransferase family 2 protein [Sebaldella sp. S0638]